jgi:hypothetical protein
MNTLAPLAEDKTDGNRDGRTSGGDTTVPDGGQLGGIAPGMEVWR